MNASVSPFRSAFYMWNGWSAIFFSGCLTPVHSHNTIQVLVDLQTGFRCRVDGSDWRSHRTLIIQEEVPHQLDTNDSMQLIIYLDAGNKMAKAIKERHLKGLKAAAPDVSIFGNGELNELQKILLKPDPDCLFRLIQSALDILAGNSQPQKPDPRISLIERYIDSCHPDIIDLDQLAGKVYLSQSRFRGLFKEQTGISLYKYILWGRIRFAINCLMNGSAVGDAASEAGFADSSHFHKTLINMFGISPSQFLRDQQSLELHTCTRWPVNFETTVYDSQGHIDKLYK